MNDEKEMIIIMDVVENYKQIKKNLPKDVKLLAVSKTKPIESIRELYDYGVRSFGESKVQEFLEKYEDLPKDIEWNFIGHLQVNKVRKIIGKVNLIQSVDSIKLLDEIENRCNLLGERVNILIEVNVGREPNKFGVLEENLPELIDEVEKMKNIKVKGIMGIIPKGNDEKNRGYFKKLKNIYEELKKSSYKNIKCEVLSMGMSQDFNIAVEEGSNLVRVGTLIFGERDYSKKL